MLFSMASGCRQPTEQVTVLAAASTAAAVEKLAREYEREHPDIRIQVVTGPSNGLAQQILAGAPADLFISANRRWAELIECRQQVADTCELLTNRLVLVVPRANPAKIRELADLNSPQVRRIAIAGPNVPAGIYATQVLQQLGWFEQLASESRLIHGSDARVTLVYVERGEVDAGLVYASDARTSERIRIVAEIAPNLHDSIVYPMVRLQPATNQAASREFGDYLQASRAKEVFQQHGFVPVR